MSDQPPIWQKTLSNELPSKRLLEFTHFGYMWATVNSQKIIASHTVYSLLGIEPYSEFLTVEKWKEYVHPLDLMKYLEAEQTLMATNEPCSIEYRIITKTGKQLFVNHSMHLSTGMNGQLKVVSILDDVTEQKRADIILEAMNESFFELDESLSFRRINEKAELFWRIRRTEIIGKKLRDIFPQAVSTAFYEFLVWANEDRTSAIRELICPVTGHWLRVSASFYADGMIVILYDIQNEKKAAAEIAGLNKNLVATNRELSSLHNELKTFTGVAAGNYSETLRNLYLNLELIVNSDARNLSNSGRANLRRAQSAIQKMKLMTDDLISFSRLQEMGAREDRVDLNDIMNKTIHEFLVSRDKDLAHFLCSELPVITGYPFLLSLLFYHLIDNAIKFIQPDRKPIIRISFEDAPGDDLPTGSATPPTFRVISISDNGIGIPAEEKERIFEMFYRLPERGSYKGAGIGLAVCRKIMEIHGGYITVGNQPATGSVFRCYFPHEPASQDVLSPTNSHTA